MSYAAPVKEMLFLINELAGLDQVAILPGFEEASAEIVQAVLAGAATFNGKVIAPLNFEGDKNPSGWRDGNVTTTAACHI